MEPIRQLKRYEFAVDFSRHSTSLFSASANWEIYSIELPRYIRPTINTSGNPFTPFKVTRLLTEGLLLWAPVLSAGKFDVLINAMQGDKVLNQLLFTDCVLETAEVTSLDRRESGDMQELLWISIPKFGKLLTPALEEVAGIRHFDDPDFIVRMKLDNVNWDKEPDEIS